MKRQSLKKQTALTAVNAALVRAVGFAMRLWVAKRLGAEAVGVMELSQGVHMLALTPFTAGLPGAVSRLTAKEEEKEQALILYAGRQMALKMAAVLTPVFLLLAPMISSWLGDGRTLPGLYCFSPCMLLIGVSCVYNGYFYGRGNAWPPAMSELGEQLVRLIATLFLLGALPRLTVAWRAAMPALATVLGEAGGLLVILWMSRNLPGFRGDERIGGIQKKLGRISFPLMVSRLSHTGLRTLCGVIIPLRLMAAGLSKSEAMSRMGMLSGMVMPLMFLPGLLAGALATVGGPAIARCKSEKAENMLAVRLLLIALLAGWMSAGGLYLLSPFLSQRLYGLAELSPLLRAMCPMAVILPVQQVAGGLMTGLGMQKKSLRASLLGGAVTLLFTWQWAANPLLTVWGAGYANMLGHGLTLLCSLISLFFRPKAPKKEQLFAAQ
ncbi:MAG: hypothetical protein E7329_11590 [Clostridiales bacterium]|nr:hypothetical protein [Clostridiales bacterium]